MSDPLDDIRHLVNRSVECINDCDMGVVTSNIDGVTLSNCAACEKQELEQAIIDYFIELVGDDEDWQDNEYAKFAIAIDGGEALRLRYEHQNRLRAELRQKIREE